MGANSDHWTTSAIPLGILVAALLGIVWTLSDHYLSTREHAEFKQHVDGELQQLHRQFDDHLRNDSQEFLGRVEFDRWVRERDLLLARIQSDVLRLETTRPSVGELREIENALQVRIEHLEKANH